MNTLSAHETATSFVPPKPSCRKPLSRMVDDDTPPRRTRKKYPNSPRTNLNDSDDGEVYEDSDISDDYDEDERNEDAVTGESPRYQHHQPLPPWYEPEGCILRNSPLSPRDSESMGRVPESTDSPTDRAYDGKYSQHYETMKNGTRTSYSNESKTNSRENRSEITREKSVKKDSDSKPKQTTIRSTCKYCFYCILAVMVIGAINWSSVSTANLTAVKTADESLRPMRLNDFRAAIAAIRNKFPRQSQDTWMDIEASVASVIDRSQRISMFLLFSNETRELRCLADYLGKASSKALLSENSLSLEPEDMGDEYGDAMDRWKNEIEEKKAVVVHNLLNVDPRAIQAFHTMCDRQNPLVKGAVYIMTIVTQDYSEGSQSPVKFVENQLTNRFIDKVPVDKLQPLITRLMDGPIIPVTPEVGRSGCPS